jgi:formylglycine-generating enzyme required for sulfatase activity
VSIAWVTVGDPGNPDDVFFDRGAVPYTYRISKYEITNAQYVEFLNAKAAFVDFLGLYNPSMGTSVFGGIQRHGTVGSYSYTSRPGRENMPVNLVSVYDAMRFANWLYNGQGDADTEEGAYPPRRDASTDQQPQPHS